MCTCVYIYMYIYIYMIYIDTNSDNHHIVIIIIVGAGLPRGGDHGRQGGARPAIFRHYIVIIIDITSM